MRRTAEAPEVDSVTEGTTSLFEREFEQHPLGFAAGDANLYRYVGNSPTNKTDPSGLLPPDPPFPINRAEREAINAARVAGAERELAGAKADLAKEIERWRKNGWVYPANLLQHFLDNSGKDHEINKSNPLNKDEIAQVKAEAHGPLKQFIGHWIANNPSIKKIEGEKISIPKTQLRFYPDFTEAPSGNLHAITKGGTQYNNNILFYAWYGVEVEIEGYITFDVKVPVRDNKMAAPKATHRLSCTQYSFVATKIKFTDHFDFPEGIRNLHPLIGAGRTLVKAGYYEMKVNATYSDYFSPFIK